MLIFEYKCPACGAKVSGVFADSALQMHKCPACGAKVERIVKRSEADAQRCDGSCHADEAEQHPLLEREEISATATMPEQWKVR